ncbi:hypothetical protein PTI98_002053 [Pleurotus ostreatus]|nr:hypothetical protein PTI98_002053 [Pleurotus ostreatus]
MNRPSEHSLNVSCMKLMMRTCSDRATNIEILYLAPTSTTDDMQPPADVDALLQFQLGNQHLCVFSMTLSAYDYDRPIVIRLLVNFRPRDYLHLAEAIQLPCPSFLPQTLIRDQGFPSSSPWFE